jgi:Domain of unknown function (DUF5979)
MPDSSGTKRRAVRRGTATIAVLALAAGALVAMSVPAFAGNNLRVDVDKVVVGTAPAGTTFTVHYSCTLTGISGDLSFDAAGAAVPANSNFFNSSMINTTCTITETGSGGASNVAYDCADDVNATCLSGNQVIFDSPTSTSSNVTFTVTNTFTPAEPEPAAAVAGTPEFTG